MTAGAFDAHKCGDEAWERLAPDKTGQGLVAVWQAKTCGGLQCAVVSERVKLVPHNLDFAEEDVGADIVNSFERLEASAQFGGLAAGLLAKAAQVATIVFGDRVRGRGRPGRSPCHS